MFDRLQVKNNLLIGGVINGGRDLRCALYFKEDEGLNHLFFSCSVAAYVWNRVGLWLGIELQHHINHCVSFVKSYNLLWVAFGKLEGILYSIDCFILSGRGILEWSSYTACIQILEEERGIHTINPFFI